MMKRLTSRWTLAALILALPVASASAEGLTLKLDPAHTQVHFSLEATGHDVHGSFSLESGEIRFDEDTGKASGEIRVDAKKSKTGNASRDKKMHEKVLESTLFPVFTFRAERFVGHLKDQGSSSIELHGTIEVHGLSHPAILVGDVERQGKVLRGKASFEVPFVKWGMHDPSVLFFRTAKTAQISVELVGELSSPELATAVAQESAAAEVEVGQDG